MRAICFGHPSNCKSAGLGSARVMLAVTWVLLMGHIALPADSRVLPSGEWRSPLVLQHGQTRRSGDYAIYLSDGTRLPSSLRVDSPERVVDLAYDAAEGALYMLLADLQINRIVALTRAGKRLSYTLPKPLIASSVLFKHDDLIQFISEDTRGYINLRNYYRVGLLPTAEGLIPRYHTLLGDYREGYLPFDRRVYPEEAKRRSLILEQTAHKLVSELEHAPQLLHRLGGGVTAAMTRNGSIVAERTVGGVLIWRQGAKRGSEQFVAFSEDPILLPGYHGEWDVRLLSIEIEPNEQLIAVGTRPGDDLPGPPLVVWLRLSPRAASVDRTAPGLLARRLEEFPPRPGTATADKIPARLPGGYSAHPAMLDHRSGSSAGYTWAERNHESGRL